MLSITNENKNDFTLFSNRIQKSRCSTKKYLTIISSAKRYIVLSFNIFRKFAEYFWNGTYNTSIFFFQWGWGCLRMGFETPNTLFFSIFKTLFQKMHQKIHIGFSRKFYLKLSNNDNEKFVQNRIWQDETFLTYAKSDSFGLLVSKVISML